MLQRFFVHLSLVVLFAFTQMGVATHEISHLSDLTQHSQQDKNTSNHACAKCITYASIAAGLITQAFVFAIHHSALTVTLYVSAYFASTSRQSYSARAPPLSV